MYIIIILIFYVLFIVFSESFFATDHWFEFTDSLGKDSTLTSRTTIWRIAKEIISENWLFGAGRGTRISYMNSWGELHFVTEAHNFVLEILMEGGVVALAVYLTLLYKIISRLDVGNIRHRIIFMALCVLLINGLTESTLNNFFVTIVLGIACRYATEERGEVDEQQIQKFKA